MQINAKDKHVMFHGQKTSSEKTCKEEKAGFCDNTFIAIRSCCRYAKFHNEGNEFRDDMKLMFKKLN